VYDRVTQAVSRMPTILAVMAHPPPVLRNFVPFEPAVIT
jgi:hypothetical protein